MGKGRGILPKWMKEYFWYFFVWGWAWDSFFKTGMRIFPKRVVEVHFFRMDEETSSQNRWRIIGSSTKPLHVVIGGGKEFQKWVGELHDG